jgi:hypothetical protein
MEEWPEWILEILISNYEKDAGKQSASVGSCEVEDMIHNFLIIMLEHSMRQKDGWKDIEATIHCAEWLSIVGGSSTGEQRIRREESLPIFKRRLFGGLLDFAARELQAQVTYSLRFFFLVFYILLYRFFFLLLKLRFLMPSIVP